MPTGIHDGAFLGVGPLNDGMTEKVRVGRGSPSTVSPSVSLDGSGCTE